MEVAIPWENYLTKLNSMATANELPDTGMMMETTVIPYAKEGMFADVSDMFAGQRFWTALHSYEGEVMAYSSANEILMLFYNRICLMQPIYHILRQMQLMHGLGMSLYILQSF